jgi:hypothetical protein
MGGLEMPGHPCCCNQPCDCEAEGASPIAAFTRTFVQVGSMLTLSLTDESTPGTCGDIVSWLYKRDGTTVSTDQNPTGISLPGAGPWTFELTVTDDAGCTDSVSMVVTKPPSSTCSTDTIYMPRAFAIDFGTLSGNPDCDDLSGEKQFDYITSATGGGITQHQFDHVFSTACGANQLDRLIVSVCHTIDPTMVIFGLQGAGNTMSSSHGQSLSYNNTFPRTTDFLNLSSLTNYLTSPTDERCATAPSSVAIRAL